MYAQNGVQRTRKERKVQIAFRPDDNKHCAGIEALLLPAVPHHKLIFTASRDSSVKRWDVAHKEAVLEASFDGHADWVNDIALIGDLLITCSNDQTVRLWKAGSDNGQHLHTLNYHSDYVTCLATSSTRNLVVSGGLRAEIFLLHIESGKHTQLYPRSSSPPPPGGSPAVSGSMSGGGMGGVSPLGVGVAGLGLGGSGGLEDGGTGGREAGGGGSVYALALNPAATLLAAGTAESLIRLLDPRTGRKVAKLRGHTDTVRSLVVSEDGSTILSGASDGTIRLWDVGMQRCLQTYTVHSDSVWSLIASDDLSVVYSGGRDRAIFRTHLASRTSELIAVEDGPVTALALEPGAGPGGEGADGGVGATVGLWAATPSPHVRKWAVPRETGGAPGAERSISVGRRSAGPTGGRLRPSLEANCQPRVRAPEAVIPGTPGIVAHEVLTDRRHVLTRDSEGVVALWDVLMGCQVETYGKVDWDAKRGELFEARAMPPWFTADTRLGVLCLTLEPPACFMAEEYAANLGYTNVPDDCKVNFGRMVLECAFAKWRHKLAAAAPGQPADPHAPYYPDTWPKYWECKALPAILCARQDGTRWRRLLSDFDGREGEPGEVPSWVGDVVLRGVVATPKEAKCAFILLPAEGSNLPSLMQSKLNAPRILQVHKVAHYCASKLQEQGIHLEVRPVYLKRPPNAPPDPPEGGQQQGQGQGAAGGGPQSPASPSGGGPRPVLELTCNGVAVPYEMSLSTVKKYVWKRSDDLTFHYKVRDAAQPAPLPVLGPSG